jgi:hypothetical protein
MDNTHPTAANDENAAAEPLLYKRREYLDAIDADASTTSCQKSNNPPDFGPDD